MIRVRIVASCLVLFASLALSKTACYGQAFGIELGTSMMPASGAMGGASIARPQDLQSCLMNNPSALTQKRGTQFSFSGGWAEPTINIDNQANLVGQISPYKAKSQRPGSVIGNIAVTQDFEALGLPVTVGLGFLTSSGLGIDYRHQLQSNGTSAEIAVLATALGAGVQVTDRLSLGVKTAVSTATMDGVFSGLSSQTPDYNLRATLGVNYDLNQDTTIGAFWTTKEKHTFDDYLRSFSESEPEFRDVSIALPSTFGIGIANQSLMCGRLLIALDALYFDWSDTDFFGALWEDQFAIQTGLQYTTSNGCKLRLGYAWAENATRDVVLPNIGGIINPTPAANYIQALLPNINGSRISGGIGFQDLLPGVDADLFAGGMFKETQQYGLTSASLSSYWVGFGLTWRFRRGANCGVGAPDRW